MHELNIHKIRPEKSDQAIGPELQVTILPLIQINGKCEVPIQIKSLS
jgi:hypothetical protein